MELKRGDVFESPQGDLLSIKAIIRAQVIVEELDPKTHKPIEDTQRTASLNDIRRFLMIAKMEKVDLSKKLIITSEMPQ